MDDRVKERVRDSIHKMVEAAAYTDGDLIDLAIDTDEWAWAYDEQTTALTQRMVDQVRAAPPKVTLTPVGQKEIERLLGLADRSTKNHMNSPDFPAPAAHLQMGRVWWAEEVIEYRNKHVSPRRNRNEQQTETTVSLSESENL